MICSEKERETCQVEKRGCEGCYYRGLTNEEVEQCLKELTEVRPEKLSDKALKIFKAIMQILDERDELKQEIAELKTQRDYYKREYSLYNKTLEEAGKVLTKRGE